jgi:hypothetical protein
MTERHSPVVQPYPQSMMNSGSARIGDVQRKAGGIGGNLVGIFITASKGT